MPYTRRRHQADAGHAPGRGGGGATGRQDAGGRCHPNGGPPGRAGNAHHLAHTGSGGLMRGLGTKEGSHMTDPPIIVPVGVTRPSSIAALTASGRSACTRPPAQSTAPSADPSRDKLAQVTARGTLVVWTALTTPRSRSRARARREPRPRRARPTEDGPRGLRRRRRDREARGGGHGTRAVLRHRRSIGDRRDGRPLGRRLGSGAITDSRMKALDMTQPYYSTPAISVVIAPRA